MRSQISNSMIGCCLLTQNLLKISESRLPNAVSGKLNNHYKWSMLMNSHPPLEAWWERSWSSYGTADWKSKAEQCLLEFTLLAYIVPWFLLIFCAMKQSLILAWSSSFKFSQVELSLKVEITIAKSYTSWFVCF